MYPNVDAVGVAFLPPLAQDRLSPWPLGVSQIKRRPSEETLMNHQTMIRRRDPAQAARDAIAADRLMDGEQPASMILEDAQHWRLVYSELIAFKRMLIATMEERMAMMSQEARAEATSIDLTLTRAQLAHYEKRFEFWNARHAMLTMRKEPEKDAV